MARCLVIHFHFQDFGGAENFSLRIAKILQKRFSQVAILHVHEAPDLSWVALHTDQQLDADKVKFVRFELPAWLTRVTSGKAHSLSLLQYAFLVRYARQIAPDFEFVVSTFAECPIRIDRMIQYIHIPTLVSDAESLHYCGLAMGPFRRALQALYIGIVRAVIGTGALIHQQLTLTNSIWTKNQFLRHYDRVDVRPFYQGVSIMLNEDDALWVPFARRENRMTMIGRMTPAKRIETGIEIVERLRARGHQIGLDIVGGGTGDYRNHIMTLAATRPWMKLYTDVARRDLEVLVARNKWGLHCYEFEHYGLAPAEMQALGCIVFVHDSGGQREVISDPLQRYRDTDQALLKIEAILQNSQLQNDLLTARKLAADRHRAADFDIRFDQLVEKLFC